MPEPDLGKSRGHNSPLVGISLVILVPFILAGLAALPILAASSLWPGLFWERHAEILCLLSGGTVYLAATGLLLWVRRPILRFLESARQIDVLAKAPGTVARSRDALDHLEGVFDQVVELLSAMDARALFPNMVGESRAMRAVFSQLLKVATTDATVLLLGESGVGKDLAAHSIHEKSGRAKGPFVPVNCAAIPDGLLESELFGHEKGAFTGAVSRKIGKFEKAAGGTLFLDEIGDMPPETQAKILRALETRQFERVGGTVPVCVDVRVVAATHRDLSEMIRQGRFREDLYHRLNVFPIHLPPLRTRREDIPLLSERMLEATRPGTTLSVEALQRLLAHGWPGNVRELKNVLERASVLSGGSELGPRHLTGLSDTGPVETAGADEGPDLELRLSAYERTLIEAALARTGGVQARAAALLGIKERSLWHRVKKLGIEVGRFRPGGS